MKVFSYIRVSGRGQVDGDGPDRQRDAIMSFCVAHNLFREAEFFEAGLSGTVEGMDRPKFNEMIGTIEASKDSSASGGIHKIDAIVVERMDRLARDLMVSEILLSECRKRNIKVFSADQGMLIDMASDGGDPTRVLIRQIMGALAQWEKAQIVKKLAIARARVKALTGRCEGRKAIPVSKADRIIFDLCANFYGTARETADFLNRAGFSDPRSGKPWTIHTYRHFQKRMAITEQQQQQPKL